MSTEQRWLQRLNEAIDYQQLQSIFTQMAAEAMEASDSRQLIASIDDAIRRIEAERSRDDQELREFEVRYLEFKEQQRGILGWFRRHLPFTETRRQEIGHRSVIADQNAEILADNLVIARAQMLKQRLLPADERQLGQPSLHWKERLADCESIERIGDFGSTIQALIEELSISSAFVEEIRGEIDAFAAADFSSSEDQQRQNADLAAAGRELAEFEAELNEELAMRDGALQRAGELVREQLLQMDHDFYQLTKQEEELQRVKRLARQAAAKAEEFEELLDRVRRLSQQRDECAQQYPQLNAEQERLREELESADARLQRSIRKLGKALGPLEEAKRAAENSEAALNAAKRLSDLQAGEAVGQAKAEYDRLSREHDQTLQQLEAARAEYETLSSKHQRRKQQFESLQRELEEAEKAVIKNERTDQLLADQLHQSRDQLPEVLAEVEPRLDQYLREIDTLPFESQVSVLTRTIQWQAALRDRVAVSVQAESVHFDSPRRADSIEKLAAAITQDEREIKKRLSAVRSELGERWTQRCHELLGAEIAQQVTGG